MIGDEVLKIQVENEELYLRKWDFKKDHEKVSKLLEIVFEKELESKGLTMKAVFEEYKSMQPFLKILSVFNKNFKHALDGFVVENPKGEIIASVNIGYGIYHWEVSMVATHPDYRRKGLARKLVTQAINHAKNLGAKICILEVVDINEPAYNLYKSLGFIHYDSVSRYKLEYDKLSLITSFEIPENYELKELERNKKTNQERYELDVLSTPEETQMFHPVNKKKYQKPLLIRLIRPLALFFIKLKFKQWTIYNNGKLVGTLFVNLARDENSPNRIEVMLDPEHSLILAKPLLTHGLRYLKDNLAFEQNTIVELRSSDNNQISVCEEYSFTVIETMHLLGLKFTDSY